MDSLDGLDRLLEAEAKAAGLIRQAETEAGAIVGKAREETHATEKRRLAELRAEGEAAFAASGTEIRTKLQRELEAYGKSLADAPLNEAAFASSCWEFLSRKT